MMWPSSVTSICVLNCDNALNRRTQNWDTTQVSATLDQIVTLFCYVHLFIALRWLLCYKGHLRYSKSYLVLKSTNKTTRSNREWPTVGFTHHTFCNSARKQKQINARTAVCFANLFALFVPKYLNSKHFSPYFGLMSFVWHPTSTF